MIWGWGGQDSMALQGREEVITCLAGSTRSASNAWLGAGGWAGWRWVDAGCLDPCPLPSHLASPACSGRIVEFAEKPKGDALKKMQVDTTILGLDAEA